MSKGLFEQSKSNSELRGFIGTRALFLSHFPVASEGGLVRFEYSSEDLYVAMWAGLAKGEMGLFVTV